MKDYPPDIEQSIEDIRALRIQGATQVALAGLDVARQVLSLERKEDPAEALEECLHALLRARPTEPCLRNSIVHVIHRIEGLSRKEAAFKETARAIEESRQHLLKARPLVIEEACRTLRKHRKIFTFCHSSTVTETIIRLHALCPEEERPLFEAFCSETRPLYQGRKTAAELASKGIPVILTVDSALSSGMDKATVALLGADAITSDGTVLNKVGSSLVASSASRKGIPLSILTDSWKYAPPSFEKTLVIEERSPAEVWPDAPRGVHIMNPAFDTVPAEFISSIITELGVLAPRNFAASVQKKYAFLKEKSR